MRLLALAVHVAILLLAFGCSKPRNAEQTSQETFDQFTKKLDQLVAVVDAAPTPTPPDNDDYVVDLRHRVGALEQMLDDLFYQTRDNTEAQATLKSISKTLAESQSATENVLNIVKLRALLTDLKAQVADLRPKLK